MLFINNFQLSKLSFYWFQNWNLRWNSVVDPWGERRDTNELIREALSASNTPRNGSNDGVVLSQRSTRVSHAHADSRWTCRAKSCVEDAITVGDGMTRNTVSVGHDFDVDILQVYSARSWVRCLTPSWSSSHSSKDCFWSNSDRTDADCENDVFGGLNNRDVISDRSRGVIFVIDDSRCCVSRSSNRSVMSGDYRNSVGWCSVDCAMSSSSDPTRIDYETTTKVGITRRSHWRLIRELAEICFRTTDDSSFPFDEVWVQSGVRDV